MQDGCTWTLCSQPSQWRLAGRPSLRLSLPASRLYEVTPIWLPITASVFGRHCAVQPLRAEMANHCLSPHLRARIDSGSDNKHTGGCGIGDTAAVQATHRARSGMHKLGPQTWPKQVGASSWGGHDNQSAQCLLYGAITTLLLRSACVCTLHSAPNGSQVVLAKRPGARAHPGGHRSVRAACPSKADPPVKLCRQAASPLRWVGGAVTWHHHTFLGTQRPLAFRCWMFLRSPIAAGVLHRFTHQPRPPRHHMNVVQQ